MDAGQRDTDQTQPAGWSSAMRLHVALIAASLLVPAALFAGAAWHSHHEVMREGRDTASRTAAIMLEHANKVFETQELALGQVDERLDSLTWDEIGAAPTQEFLPAS